LLREESRQIADRLLEHFPEDPQAHDAAGSIRYWLGEVDAARKLWEECLTLDAAYVDARISLGMLMFESGKFAEAETTLRSALQQSPGHPQAVYLLGSAMLNQGKLAETVDLLEGNRSGGSAPVPNLVLLGQTYLQLKDAAKARDCFQSAIDAAPEYPNAYFGLAAALSRLGQQEEATAYRQKFRELQTQQLRQGIEQGRGYNDLQSTSTELAETYFAVASLYAARGELQVAEEVVQLALRLDPNNAQYQQAYAVIRGNR